jgi:hypothetical protein
MEYSVTDPILFPSRAAHTRAWEELAHAIAANSDTIAETAATPPAVRGDLTIIGSGIETVGFALGDEALIRAADAVFFCVADPATVVWLKSIRPDAYDLYVLYDDNKVRYTTYMQMTEAMLHFVRQGQRVVAIFYGHPGIFVLSTHRAILIAKREGHRAVMRPGVCALDCLCADLGVDPCHPGMQTHEATDMLIRGRVPDTSLHVVLWQVGLIGEMGFRRKGYINENFSVFIEYLQKYYGDDYPIIHYVASRYPTIDPLIESYPLSELHDPRVQVRVTGVSTFYLPPKDNAEADRDMLYRLGLLKPGQELRVAEGPLREIGKYGSRERKAFRAFRRFQVPKGYQWQEDTGASRFLIALRQDLDLCRRYTHNPRETLSPAAFPNLTERERGLLITRDPGAIQVAAKGSFVASITNRTMLTTLFQKKTLQLGLLKHVRQAPAENLISALQQWSERNGLPADWERMRTDIDLCLRDCLFPWTGIYCAETSGDNAVEQNRRLIVLTGDGKKARLSVDGEPVRRFTFKRGTLEWRSTLGRVDNGYLRVDVDSRGHRRLIGSIWPQGETVPAEHRLVLTEVPLGHQHPASLVGTHIRDVNGKREQLDIMVMASDEQSRHLGIRLNGDILEGALCLEGRKLTVNGQAFLMAGSTALAENGHLEPVWQKDNAIPYDLCGTYATKILGGGRYLLELSPDEIRIDGVRPITMELASGQVSWSGGPEKARCGQLTLLLDPITLLPFLFGTVENQLGVRTRCHGFVPPAAGLSRAGPEMGLSQWHWERLVNLAMRPDQSGGSMLWYQVEKANLAATIVNAYLSRRLP